MDYLTWGEWVALEQHFMYGKHEFRRAKGVSWVNTWQSEGQLNTAFWGCRQPPRCDDKEIWDCQSGMPRHRFNYNQNRYLGENLHYGETTRIKVNPDGVSKEMMGDEIVAIESCFALGSSVWRNNQKALVKISAHSDLSSDPELSIPTESRYTTCLLGGKSPSVKLMSRRENK